MFLTRGRMSMLLCATPPRENVRSITKEKKNNNLNDVFWPSYGFLKHYTGKKNTSP